MHTEIKKLTDVSDEVFYKKKTTRIKGVLSEKWTAFHLSPGRYTVPKWADEGQYTKIDRVFCWSIMMFWMKQMPNLSDELWLDEK